VLEQLPNLAKTGSTGVGSVEGGHRGPLERGGVDASWRKKRSCVVPGSLADLSR